MVNREAVVLRLPDKVIEWLSNEAEERGISRNALITLILTKEKSKEATKYDI